MNITGINMVGRQKKALDEMDFNFIYLHFDYWRVSL